MAGYARKSLTRNQRRRKVVEQKLMGIALIAICALACVHRSYTGGKRLYGGSSHRPYRVIYAFLKANRNPLISQFAAFHHSTVELSAIIAGFPN